MFHTNSVPIKICAPLSALLCRAQDANEYSLSLDHGDVLLVATDRLWDNVDLEQIVYCVCTFTDMAKCGQDTVLMRAYGNHVNV